MPFPESAEAAGGALESERHRTAANGRKPASESPQANCVMGPLRSQVRGARKSLACGALVRADPSAILCTMPSD